MAALDVLYDHTEQAVPSIVTADSLSFLGYTDEIVVGRYNQAVIKVASTKVVASFLSAKK